LQDKFAERVRLLISVLFPTIVLQFTISNSLPKTYTLLSPQLLAFVSLLELALFTAICCVTNQILNRKEHVAWYLPPPPPGPTLHALPPLPISLLKCMKTKEMDCLNIFSLLFLSPWGHHATEQEESACE
jgi:hypothetical protein